MTKLVCLTSFSAESLPAAGRRFKGHSMKEARVGEFDRKELVITNH
jgi:hypothetical protein